MLFSESPILMLPALTMSASFSDLVAFFRSHPSASLCPVVDFDRRPIGYVALSQFQQMVASPYGHALNEKKGVMGNLNTDVIIVALKDDAKTIFRELSDQKSVLSHGLVIVDQTGAYVGCLNSLGVFDVINRLHARMLSELEAEIVVRERAEREIKQLADSDALTGILNRRAFVAQVERLTDSHQPFTCVFVDLDRFKVLNDKYGHAVGDQVLKTVASRLKASDIAQQCCRLGGDEFAFLLSASDVQEAQNQLAQIHSDITSSICTKFGLVSVGASIGSAIYPVDAVDKTSLLHAADKAMLRAKASGGGARSYDRSLDTDNLDAEAYDNAVVRAVSDSKIKPAAQPILCLRTGEIIGHEVLARWPDSEFTQDPTPVQFIPVIERLGLLDAMFWSLVDASLQWAADGDGFISLNVSPSQLNSMDFVATFAEILHRRRIRASRIEIEITEHNIFRNIDRSSQVLEALVRQGMSLALDDFGTGYSSLSLLEQLPFKKVKLDRSLLSGPVDGAAPSKVLPATIKLCDELGLITCAEGAEVQGHLDLLRSYGCQQAQGYFIGRPTLCREIPTPKLQRLAS
ncbi:MAG: hypothetical protein Hens3KO_02800 [Henriciella sp.]